MSASDSGSTTEAQSETEARTVRAREEDIDVECVSEAPNSVSVTVSNDDDSATYDVTVGKEYTMPLGCTCKDWMFRARRENSSCDAQKGCKHMRAVALQTPDGDLHTVVESLINDGVDESVIRDMVDAPARTVDVAITQIQDGPAAALELLAE